MRQVASFAPALLAGTLILLPILATAQQSLPPGPLPGTPSGSSPQPATGATSAPTTATPMPPTPATQPGGGANQTLLQLLNLVNTLQEEVQQLRGEIEEQTHQIETIKTRQRDLYLDLDRRLQRVEVTGTSAPQQPVAPVTPVAPAMGTTTPPASAPTLAPTAAAPTSGNEREDYQVAFNLLKDGQYPQAIAAFRNFIANHPSGNYADNAQYWLGEARYVSRDFQQAINEFQVVINRFPMSPKVPDAKLKMGYARYELNDSAGARAILQEIIARHADSTAARLAEKRLERMDREGR